MFKEFLRASSLITLTVAMMVGCKAAPAPSVGFADPNKLKPDPNIPFNKFWRKPGLDWNTYDKIYVADVNTAYMLNLTDWQKGERQADIEKDVKTVADYARDAVKKSLKEDPRHRFTVLDAPTKDPHAVVLEVALIEVVPQQGGSQRAGLRTVFYRHRNQRRPHNW